MTDLQNFARKRNQGIHHAYGRISNRRKRAAWKFMGIRIWQESDIQHCILPPNNRSRQSVHFIYGGSFCHCTALTHYVHADCLQIKWPNDIYWKDKKIAGILIENDLTGSQISQSIIGIGININQGRISFICSQPCFIKTNY